MTLQKFLQNKQCDIFDILQEFLQRQPFLMSRNFETHGCQWYGVKRIKYIFVDKGIAEQSLGHLFIT